MIKKAGEMIEKYQESFYMFFVLTIFGLMSIGQGSDFILYRVLFPFAMIAWAFKFFSTPYTKREWFWIILIGGLLFINLLRNHEKTLVLSFLAIVGAKDVDLGKVLKWALWERIALTVGTVSLALMGVIENIYVGHMPKYMHGEWKAVNLYCYGYTHPNHAYLECFTIAILVVLVYFEKLKWYGYLLLSFFMYGAYRVLVCRTGWVTWLATMAIMICYAIAKKIKLDRIYLKCLSVIPLVLTAFSLWGMSVSEDVNTGIGEILNQLFTGRMKIARADAYPQIFWTFIGHNPRAGMDLAYVHMIYNYGWIISIAFLGAYVWTMLKLAEKRKDGWCIALAAMAGYIIGEVPPLNVGWNITLILLSVVLFQESVDVDHESECVENKKGIKCIKHVS